MHDVTTDPQPATAPGPVAVTSAPVIAVLTYRRPDDLAQVLPALVVQAAATAPRARVLVVDNDPDAGAREAVAAFAADGVEYAHEPQPGIAAARNRALDAAGDAEPAGLHRRRRAAGRRLAARPGAGAARARMRGRRRARALGVRRRADAVGRGRPVLRPPPPRDRRAGRRRRHQQPPARPAPGAGRRAALRRALRPQRRLRQPVHPAGSWPRAAAWCGAPRRWSPTACRPRARPAAGCCSARSAAATPTPGRSSRWPAARPVGCGCGCASCPRASCGSSAASSAWCRAS
nr:glycosyltransferase family A protein [Angustibacter aerolatus]